MTITFFGLMLISTCHCVSASQIALMLKNTFKEYYCHKIFIENGIDEAFLKKNVVVQLFTVCRLVDWHFLLTLYDCTEDEEQE